MARRSPNQQGSIIVSILFITLFLTTIIFGMIVLANSNLARARGRVLLLQAQYSAESGVDAAIAILNSGNTSYTGTGGSEVTVLTTNLYRSTYTVSVANGATAKEKLITSTGKVYAPASVTGATQSRTIEVLTTRSSNSTTASLLSRNILEAESGVKNIWSSDIYVNGYIKLNKNTTNLIGENITVGDKRTGAGNCSIVGPGNLLKPPIFSDPTQLKTNITVAYNNCISPPGNTSNLDFNVAANQTNIGKVQSTYIPWSEYMDSSYQDSPGGCSDWTTGASPRNIPSAANPKSTHYPDSGNGVSTACGSSGDLNLGSDTYNILDHVHIRANLCAATACTPTFYNPDQGAAGLKFIFIEGSVNFDAINTAIGSGPMVFINYGPDPASKASVCPLGGAFYLGKNGITIAPAAYFIAMNGVCIDKTKFGAATALAGLSGKNLWIASNPGTPFDLSLDLGFPYQSIPIDLSWRATRYRRL